MRSSALNLGSWSRASHCLSEEWLYQRQEQPVLLWIQGATQWARSTSKFPDPQMNTAALGESNPSRGTEREALSRPGPYFSLSHDSNPGYMDKTKSRIGHMSYCPFLEGPLENNAHVFHDRFDPREAPDHKLIQVYRQSASWLWIHRSFTFFQLSFPFRCRLSRFRSDYRVRFYPSESAPTEQVHLFISLRPPSSLAHPTSPPNLCLYLRSALEENLCTHLNHK